MKAIIPVAGSGTRLRPLTHTKPKALLYVGSKPIIVHIVDNLIPLGCDSFVFIISHEGEDIPLCIKEYYPDIMIETIVQHDRLGIGHAVSLTEDIVGNDEILIVYGDTIIIDDISEIKNCDADGLIVVKEVEDPRQFGVVNICDGFITEFEEKPLEPRSNMVIVGFNYFRTPCVLYECLNEIIETDKKTKGEYQITDAFQLMIERGMKIKPFAVDIWFDCGTPQTLIETNRHMLSREKKKITVSGSIIIPPVYIHDTAELSNSIIGPFVSIGRNTFIDHSIISDSIIGSGARVKNAFLVSSLIGDNAVIADHPKSLIIGDNSSINYDDKNFG